MTYAERLGLHRRDLDDTSMWCRDGEPVVWFDGSWWWCAGVRCRSELAALKVYRMTRSAG